MGKCRKHNVRPETPGVRAVKTILHIRKGAFVIPNDSGITGNIPAA